MSNEVEEKLSCSTICSKLNQMSAVCLKLSEIMGEIDAAIKRAEEGIKKFPETGQSAGIRITQTAICKWRDTHQEIQTDVENLNDQDFKNSIMSSLVVMDNHMKIVEGLNERFDNEILSPQMTLPQNSEQKTPLKAPPQNLSAFNQAPNATSSPALPTLPENNDDHVINITPS